MLPFFELDGRDLRFWAASFGAALAVVTGLYLAAELLTPAGQVFSGFLHDSHDGLSYRVWSYRFSLQGLLVDNPWALTPREPAWFNLVWFVVGRLMAAGVPFMVAYRALQVVAGAWMYLALLALLREFFRDRVRAWCAYLLAGFGTGLSWLVYLCSPTMMGGRLIPGDIIHGDSFPVHTLWTFPHLALSWAMLATIYLCFFRAVARGQRRWAAGGALVALAMGFAHPYHFATILPVLSVWYLVLTLKHGRQFARRWPDLGLLLGGMLPAVLYYRWFLSSSPNFPDWVGRNVMATAGVPHLVLGFGLILLLALLGYRGLLPLGSFTDRYLLVAVWAPVNLAMHLSHPLVFFSQRLGEGLMIPLAVLATWAFYGTFVPLLGRHAGGPTPETDILEGPPPAAPPPGTDGRRLRWALALTVLLLPDTGLHMANQLRMLHTGTPLFDQGVDTKVTFSPGELEALEYVGEHARGEPLFLAGPDTGLVLPAYAPVRSLLGHITQTADYEERMAAAVTFYGSGVTDVERRQILGQYGIDYVWWGADEDQDGGTRPEGVDFLQRVYGNGTVTIYRVDRAGLAR